MDSPGDAPFMPSADVTVRGMSPNETGASETFSAPVAAIGFTSTSGRPNDIPRRHGAAASTRPESAVDLHQARPERLELNDGRPR